MTMPDSLVNSLIVHKRSGMTKRVIRDDGENGLWISHPAQASTMHRISRDEFRAVWDVKSSSAQQEGSKSVYEQGNPYTDLGLEGFTFDEQKTGPVGRNEVKLDANQAETVPTVVKGAL